MVVETSGHKAGRVPQYVCNRFLRQGTCTNKMRVNVDDMNEAVMQAIEEHALTPEAVEQVVALSERDEVPDRQRLLELEAADVAKRIHRLVTVIATTEDAPDALVASLRELEARGKALAADIAATRPIPRLPRAVVESRRDVFASTLFIRSSLRRMVLPHTRSDQRRPRMKLHRNARIPRFRVSCSSTASCARAGRTPRRARPPA